MSGFNEDEFVSDLNEYISSELNIDKYEVRNNHIFGPSLYANKDFSIGEVVVLEHSKFITTSDLLNSMKQYDNLELIPKYFKVDADYVIDNQSLKASNDEHPCLKNWISAFSLNGYTFSGNQEKTGLYIIASKAAHSCSPNVATITNVNDETLSFVAVKPISKGSMIMSSYLDGNKLVYPTVLRRNFIKKQYYFDCQCDRCCGVDNLRPLNCEICSGKCCVYHNTTSNLWVCNAPNCGEVFDTEKAEENLYVDVDEQAQEQLKCFDDINNNSDDHSKKVLIGTLDGLNMLTKYIPKSHWTVIFMKRVLIENTLRGRSTSTDTGNSILSNSDFDQFSIDIAVWLYEEISQYSPITAACILHPYKERLFEMLPDNSSTGAVQSATHMRLGNAHQQRQQLLLKIMRYLYTYYEIQYGNDDDDVKDWKRRVL